MSPMWMPLPRDTRGDWVHGAEIWVRGLVPGDSRGEPECHAHGLRGLPSALGNCTLSEEADGGH